MIIQVFVSDRLVVNKRFVYLRFSAFWHDLTRFVYTVPLSFQISLCQAFLKYFVCV
jgi:hypothetical protein